jgi:hypothetical protein
VTSLLHVVPEADFLKVLLLQKNVKITIFLSLLSACFHI